MRILKSNPILGLLNSYLVDNPEPANISYMWNFGSLLGMCLVIQILTGIFLAMHYCPNVDLAFASVEHIMRDVNYGWAIRYVHANTASFFFLFMYFHVGRGLYYGSYKSPRVLPWAIGVVILILTMATAFLGYVLPYGQMSLWGEKYCPTCNDSINIQYDSMISIIYSSIILIIIYVTNTNKYVKRIRSKYRIGPHNKNILSVITGSLLGNSHAEMRKKGDGTRISFSQESNRVEYLLWLHSIVSDMGYCNPTQPKIQSRIGIGGKIRYIIRFHTFTYQSLNWIRETWYKDGIKRVPENIKEYLSPLAIAIWIINDGSRSGKSIKWCTNSFSYEDCVRITNILYKLYNVKCSVNSAGKKDQYVIYVLKESMATLRNLVKDYMVSSMLYKIQE